MPIGGPKIHGNAMVVSYKLQQNVTLACKDPCYIF